MVEGIRSRVAYELEQEQRYGEALEIFQRIRRNGGVDTGDALFHCGWCLEQLAEANRGRALKYYRRASLCLTASPALVNSFFRIGWLSFHDKKYAEAASSFRRAIDVAEGINLQTDLYHNSVYWFAVSLESDGLFLEALKWYQLVMQLAPLFEPEAHYREICCLNQIGAFKEALVACQVFPHEAPVGFDLNRYQELNGLVKAEAILLKQCLAEPTMSRKEESQLVSS